MTSTELTSAVLQLVVDESPERVLVATHDALLIASRVLREHDPSNRERANAIAFASHLVGQVRKEAWPE